MNAYVNYEYGYLCQWATLEKDTDCGDVELKERVLCKARSFLMDWYDENGVRNLVNHVIEEVIK